MLKAIWPNFFIVGAPRSGTTSLYEYLRRVPGIYMPTHKEPHYFAASVRERYLGRPILDFGVYSRVRNQGEYLKLFARVENEVAVGEASASYLSDPEAPGRIKEAVPEARIIMILRDPVERVYSHYLLYVSQGWERSPFEEAARLDLYLEPTFYAKQVQRYLDVFGPDHVKVLIFEEFIRYPTKSVAQVLKFLGVNAEPPAIAGEAYNSFAAPRWLLIGPILRSRPVRLTMRVLPRRIRWIIRAQTPGKKANKPPMTRTTRRFLEDAFRGDVLSLEQILGRSLPWYHARDRLGEAERTIAAGGISNTSH